MGPATGYVPSKAVACLSFWTVFTCIHLQPISFIGEATPRSDTERVPGNAKICNETDPEISRKIPIAVHFFSSIPS